MPATTLGSLAQRSAKFGVWILLLIVSAPCAWAAGFPTDFHAATPAEARDLLQAICSADATDSGCRSCPEFIPEEFRRGFMDDSNTVNWRLLGVIYGSFTRPGVREAVADFGGCLPHAAGEGGAVLLEKKDSGWKFESFGGGGLTNDCMKYPLNSGRDELICKGEYHAQGELSTSLYAVDYSAPERDRGETLLTVYDTVAACLSDINVGSIEDVQLRDLNHDGMPDIVVHVKAAEMPRTSGSEQNCIQPEIPPGIRLRELDFLFSDGKFKLAPWSEAAMRELHEISRYNRSENSPIN